MPANQPRASSAGDPGRHAVEPRAKRIPSFNRRAPYAPAPRTWPGTHPRLRADREPGCGIDPEPSVRAARPGCETPPDRSGPIGIQKHSSSSRSLCVPRLPESKRATRLRELVITRFADIPNPQQDLSQNGRLRREGSTPPYLTILLCTQEFHPHRFFLGRRTNTLV